MTAPTAQDDSTAAPLPTDLQDPRIKAGQSFLARLRSGDLGPLPVILGLIVIVIVFGTLSDSFLTSFNLVNLTLQISATGTIALGIVLVLLLGEIDLSVGSVSGLSGAILVVLNTNQGYGPVVAIGGALLGGALIGLVQGLIFTKVGVPSFVVTLSGLLIWQGVQLYVLGEQGTINLPPNGAIVKFGQLQFMPDNAAYVVAVLVGAGYLLIRLNARRRRLAASLSAPSMVQLLARAAVLVALLCVAVWKLNQDRGVSYMFLLFLALVLIFSFITARTRFGRNIYAVGGNIEAARRAGIRVDRLRTSIFVICSTLAALGGVLAAARLGSVSQSSGQGDVLINAIAAAVIGGTSLFGGRGSPVSALLGILVIGAIANGLIALSLSADVRFIITGLVLLLAVTIDAVSRRGRTAAGRA